MGPCHQTKYKVAFCVFIQILSVHLLQEAGFWTQAFCCYTLSGAINHMMTLAMHELSHNLGHKKVTVNRFLGFFANAPMGIPASASFKRYHMEHHRFQGEDVVDVDVPTELEGVIFHNTPLKVLWCFLQPAFYSLRPMFVNPKDPKFWEFVNYGIQFCFDAFIVHFWGWSGLAYLVFGTLLGMGLHPVAGHFIAEVRLDDWMTGEETWRGSLAMSDEPFEHPVGPPLWTIDHPVGGTTSRTRSEATIIMPRGFAPCTSL